MVTKGLVDADADTFVSADRADNVPVKVLLPKPGQVLAHQDVVVEKQHPTKLTEELLEQNKRERPMLAQRHVFHSSNGDHDMHPSVHYSIFTSGRWILR